MSDYESDEMMSVEAARQLRDTTACFVGIGLPSTGANLARRTHNPELVLVYEAGAIGAKPPRLPLSIGDGMLGETADSIASVPEIFNYWVQPGRIDVGFLGAAQIDRFANINTTVVGDYASPEGPAAGRGRRAGDRRVVRRGDRDRAPVQARVRGEGGLHHVRRPPRRSGRA